MTITELILMMVCLMSFKSKTASTSLLQDDSALEGSPYFLWMDSNPVSRRPKMLECIPEVNPINFAPHIRAPEATISGRYDEVWPFKSASEPLYELPPEPKQLEVFDGGHGVPLEVSVPILNTWLDKTLGPVRHE